MIETEANELRRLCEDYYHGLLPREQYRSRRARLIDSLVGLRPGTEDTTRPQGPAVAMPRAQPAPAVPAAEPPPAPDAGEPPAPPAAAPVAPAAATSAAAASAPKAAPAADAGAHTQFAVRRPVPAAEATPVQATPVQAAPVPPPASSRSRLPLVAGVVAAVVAIAVAALWLRGRDQAPPPVESAPAAAPAAAGAVPDDRARGLARQFLTANDWSDPVVRKLAQEWGALPADLRREAALAPWFATLQASVQEAIVGRQRTQLKFGEEPVDPQDPIYELARSLGIEIGPLTAAARGSSPAPATAAATGAAAAAAPAVKSAPAAGRAEPATATAVTAAAAAQDSAAKPAAIAAARKPSAAAASAPAAGAAAATVAAAAAAASARPCVRERLQTRDRSCFDMLASGEQGPAMMLLPAGAFTLGSSAPAEAPTREVRIAEPFALQVFEVSIGDLKLYCAKAGKSCPPLAGADDLPATGVSWQFARDYAAWLSGATGHRYRLPSEAEWEYAARAGTQTVYPTEDGDKITVPDAIFSDRAKLSGPVAGKAGNANRYKLRHMLGNVREWVADAWNPNHAGAPGDGSARERGDGSAKVVKGGSFADGMEQVRPASRERLDAGAADQRTGFRLAREL